MARRREAVTPPDDPLDLYMTLAGGPGGPDDLPYSEEQLALGWQKYREELTEKPRQPGERLWAYWHFELGMEKPATRLEEVLALQERGLLTEEEREEISAEAEYARKGGYKPNPYVVTTPKEAEEDSKRFWREREQEALAIAEALERCS